ncbi:MAG: glycoside hydrolase family 28 protein, partial [Terracidiphilus sp.]
ARQAFNMSAYPNAPLENFRLDHLDIEAAHAGTIANAKNWTLTDNIIQTTDGSKPVFTDSSTQDPTDIPYGEPR